MSYNFLFIYQFHLHIYQIEIFNFIFKYYFYLKSVFNFILSKIMLCLEYCCFIFFIYLSIIFKAEY